MGRLGIYGVSVFYVLSGLTLHYVYFEKMKPSGQDLWNFAKKRLFRILPLLWLATISAILLSNKTPNFYYLFLNLTGLFGFVKWATYFSTGVWSIGNELVFYAFFPLFVWLTKHHGWAMWLLSFVLFVVYLYFAFFLFQHSTPLAQQWNVYVNPLNQILLFLGGFLMGVFFHHKKTNTLTASLLGIFGLLTFIFLPATGDSILLVTGINRLIFTGAALFICFGFYKVRFPVPWFIHQPLTLLGEASYSIYLLHPIVHQSLNQFVFKPLSIHDYAIRTPVAVVVTLVVSYFSYQYFEQYFIRLGGRR